MFFFEKKNQKTFARFDALLIAVVALLTAANQAEAGPFFISGWDNRRLPKALPKHLIEGTPAQFHIDAPLWFIEGVELRQNGPHGDYVRSKELKLQPAPGGGTLATFTPLANGRVEFIIQASFYDLSAGVEELSADVDPPSEAPIGFFADRLYRDPKVPIYCSVGGDRGLSPVVVFGSDPTEEIGIAREATYSVVSQDDPPVIAIGPQGGIHPLRKGHATLQINFGKFFLRKEVTTVLPYRKAIEIWPPGAAPAIRKLEPQPN